MPEISIYESEVSCLSSIVDLDRRCQNQKLKLSRDAQQYMLYVTLTKVGPAVAQKAVSKLVAKGELVWDDNEDFEVEQILDYIEENETKFYLIKWKGWNHAHNSWEPKNNLECEDLMEEFHIKNPEDPKATPRLGMKRKFDEIKEKEQRESKRTRIDELFTKLKSCKEVITPLKLMELTSPDKGKKQYSGVLGCEGLKVPKYNNTGTCLNKRTKAFKTRQKEIQKALKEWESHLNNVSTDPASIAVENLVDLEGPPENFVYINDYKPGEGIVIHDDPVIGCECTDCTNCKGACCAAQFNAEYAYYSNKRLRIPVGRPIYECNKRCLCGPECSNRVVQQGRKHKVCVFRTKGRGWGVKALQKIKKGTFVMEYVGEVISNDEAEIRGKTYDSVCQTYLFDLDFTEGDCPYTVDAAVYGNVSHFVNHSCDPNLEVFNVWINSLDSHMPRIALFSRRDIEKGEELTFDYLNPKEEESETGTCETPEIETPEIQTTEIPTTDASESISLPISEEELTDAVEKTSEEIDSAPVTNNVDANKPITELVTLESKLDDDTQPLVSRLNNGVMASEENKLNEQIEQRSVESSPVKKLTSPAKKPAESKKSYRMVCQCGAKNCRKFVFQ